MKDRAIEMIKDLHEGNLPDVVNRDLELKLPKAMKAITIIGPRRAGKTYFLYNIMKRFNDVERERMLYINLEDDRLLPLELSDLDILLNSYYEIYPDNRKRMVYLFLDEVQNVDGWEIFVRRVLDGRNIRPFITGSSSKIMTREIATSMRGRSLSHLILPFSFSEFLRARCVEVDEYLSSAKRSIVMRDLRIFLELGGFPEVVLEDDDDLKIRILKDYVEVMLIRDIVERHSVRNIKVLRMLFHAILSSYAKQFSAHKFHNSLKSQGIKVSKNTIYEYIQYLEDTFSIFSIRRFSHSLREKEQSLPKIYVIDNGYAAKIGSSSSLNIGRLMENAVAIEWFRRMSQNPLLEVYYWRDNRRKEVDFVIKEGLVIRELVQVCYDLEEYDTRVREITALEKAGEELGCKDLKIITWDRDDSEIINGKQISFIPLWKWLLGRA